MVCQLQWACLVAWRIHQLSLKLNFGPKQPCVVASHS